MIGLPGAGKSTVARLLAIRLGVESVDLDVEVERGRGRSVSAIFEEEGEAGFRDLESRALEEVLAGSRPVVVACGGGILERPENRELLASRALVVWLAVDPTIAAERLKAPGAGTRPLLKGSPLPERLRALLECRAESYADAADEVVSTDGSTPEEIADRIATRVRWDRSGS